MTNKTINGVPREQIQRAIDAVEQVGYQDKFIDYKFVHAVKSELRALLAAPDPTVEADGIGEPVAEVLHGPFDDVGCPQWVRVVTIGDFDLENLPDGTKLYSADQLAALQSTITRLESEAFYSAAGFQAAREEIAQLKAENERLRADADQNVEWEETFGPDYTGDAGISASVKLPARNEASKNLDLEQCGYVDGWNACLDEVRRMNP